MWQEINAYATDAVDANLDTIGKLRSAMTACNGDGGAALAKIYLADLEREANELDTRIRRFMLAIGRDVKTEAALEEERNPKGLKS